MRFMTDDGKTFDTMEKAEAYEKELAEKESARMAKEKERESREKEIQKKVDEVKELCESFMKDYHTMPNCKLSFAVGNIDDIWKDGFEELFDILPSFRSRR